jgi:hypothetical protein
MEVSMKKAWKYVGIAALVVVLAVGSMAVIAYAQEPVGETDGPFDFFGRFRQNLASILGISVEQYDSAVGQARDQTLDEAVAEGWLTQDQADQMRERMEYAPDAMPRGMGPGQGMMGGRGMMGGPGMMGRDDGLVAVAAEQLGMTQDDLRAALRDGQTIAGLAEEQGIDAQTIADAHIAQLTEKLNQAVADGEMTQNQADWMLEQAQDQVVERINGTWEKAPGDFHGHRGGRPGPGRPSEDTDTGTDSGTDM